MRQAGTWNEFLASKGKKFPEILIFFCFGRTFSKFSLSQLLEYISTTYNVCGQFYIFFPAKIIPFSFCLIWVSGQFNSNDVSVDGTNNGTLVTAQTEKKIQMGWWEVGQNLLTTVAPSKITEYFFPFLLLCSSLPSFLPNLPHADKNTYALTQTQTPPVYLPSRFKYPF